ncbi:uncharacterized protein LOC124120896 [Haliotis rufescens]|uniref:uncharacterized protein LOC124120896 n=1 Tax=Haliotis rufescens TaxID=6454 RepID=UPI001EAFC366|nr:uncharacterized protein LOC124120896 [Haliotis rufescens]
MGVCGSQLAVERAVLNEKLKAKEEKISNLEEDKKNKSDKIEILQEKKSDTDKLLVKNNEQIEKLKDENSDLRTANRKMVEKMEQSPTIKDSTLNLVDHGLKWTGLK